MDWTSLLAGSACLLALAAWAGCAVKNRSLARLQHETAARQQALENQLELLRQSISGLTAGAVGMDRRMLQIETRGKLLAERQETYENQQVDEQPYGEAIRLVHQGAGKTRLVDELALSESEADLIVRLHGHRQTA